MSEINNLDIKKVDKNGNTILHNAVMSCQLSLVRNILSIDKSLVNVTNSRGRTPLYLVAITLGPNKRRPKRSVLMAKLLLDAGADINVKSDEGTTALLAAAHNGDEELALYLCKRGANVNVVSNDGFHLLHHAVCAEVSDKIVQRMVKSFVSDYKADINFVCTKRDATTLHAACWRETSKVCKTLLKLGADWTLVTKFGSSVFAAACVGNHFDVVKILHQKSGTLPSISLAYENGYKTTALHLICQAYTPIYCDVLRYLLLHGADPNALDSKGCTPMHYMVDSERFTREELDMFVGMGADLKIKDKHGRCVADCTKRESSLAILKND